MTKVSSIEDYHHEKAIIDALLKISEIVQKTETNRQVSKTKKQSKRTIGDGDYNEMISETEQQQVPLPPAIRTLESYVSGFNQNSSQKDPINRHSSINRYQSSSEHSRKRHRAEISSMVDSLSDPRTACNINLDQELQITVEKYVTNQLLSPMKSLRDDIQKQRQTRLRTFNKSPTNKLINELHPSQSIANLHHYKAQVSHQREIPSIHLSFLPVSISSRCY